MPGLKPIATSTPFDAIVRDQHAGRPRGICAVCSAHPLVLEAAIAQARDDGTTLLVESTSNQVNQFGGYTGQTPVQFAERLQALAAKQGIAPERMLLGGDHLGPHPFRKQPAEQAMSLAAEMIRGYVAAGFQKIHLDTSMACGGDAVGANGAPAEHLVAARAAQLCAVAESTARTTFGTSDHLRYIVGTEVPPPGGETGVAEIQATKPADVERTIHTVREAFEAQQLSEVWNRVIAVVVQPGVDFSDSSVVRYDRPKAAALKQAIEVHPTLIYEAHSTDYQHPAALRALVEDHFAILKVGPWLTFAMREALFALAMIEEEWLAGRRDCETSQLRKVLEEIMLSDPSHWRDHYTGDEPENKFARAYSYSDRIRYYWPQPRAAAAVQKLFRNLEAAPPMPLVHQYLPLDDWQLREHGESWNPRAIVLSAIRRVLNDYAAACQGDPT
ncbi:MAG: class II D-tagatose-bisphosphate aldolase, non-catalytic subunit [Pirellulales bacterium]|nr:class II D-tagatose-bisphosphate aldolase, non-catalytic subunit [Pirellulales bacterium]